VSDVQVGGEADAPAKEGGSDDEDQSPAKV
jgi:hypothetical protein